MNKAPTNNTDASYRLAEEKAADYFKLLSVQLTNKTYATTITKQLQNWKQNHIRQHSIVSFFSRGKGKPDSRGYYKYIQWLDYTGKLDNYLDRSISYIFMRDLGKDLSSPKTQYRIQEVVNNLKMQLIDSTAGKTKMFDMAWLYRLAQKNGVESTMIWVMDRLKIVSSHIPKGMDAEEAKRKLIKIIAGVIMHQVEEMGDNVSNEERTQKLDKAIRLGYCYGLTYPFIDDLLDSEVLSDNEKRQYTDIIRETLTTGIVPEIKAWNGDNEELIQFIHAELREAFTYIKTHLRQEISENFFEQTYVFFQSQEEDRVKELSNANYTNEELYIPVILKSASSRLIVRSVLSAPEDEEFDNRTFYYGIYNQLADDFADMFSDLEAGAVTPYTYYLTYHEKRNDLINPFELYWTVISHLMHNVYHSEPKTCEVILNRAINGLKRFKERVGRERYDEVMERFASGNPKFNKILQRMVRKADDVDFFDKLLRDQIIANFKGEQLERQDFIDTIKSVRNQINDILPISTTNCHSSMKEPIIDAANYSLKGDGKRLRPIITWVMGVNEYGLDRSAIMPLLKSLEYMHTASLIFDDLPSQDNASIRRGRPTLHQLYNTATAELTGLYLTQKAVEEQASLAQFEPKAVLQFIRYSAEKTTEMCQGQLMDLDSKGKSLTVEQLNTMCFYKTGIAFEAALVMPAILAGKSEVDVQALKTYAYHAGIAFQIKDDLLDIEGDLSLLGKPIGKDAENNNSNFVSVLGTDNARKAMWEHYCLAMDVLQEMQLHTHFLKHLLDYIMNRDY